MPKSKIIGFRLRWFYGWASAFFSSQLLHKLAAGEWVYYADDKGMMHSLKSPPPKKDKEFPFQKHQYSDKGLIFFFLSLSPGTISSPACLPLSTASQEFWMSYFPFSICNCLAFKSSLFNDSNRIRYTDNLRWKMKNPVQTHNFMISFKQCGSIKSSKASSHTCIEKLLGSKLKQSWLSSRRLIVGQICNGSLLLWEPGWLIC